MRNQVKALVTSRKWEFCIIGIIMLNPNKWLAVPPSRSLFTIDPIWESF